MNYRRLICYDLEMCCWSRKEGKGSTTGEIIEIGVAAVNLQDGVITDRSQYYVRPEKDDISEYCTNLTGITQKLLDKQGVPLADAINSMRGKYGHHSVYGAWGRDDRVLQAECEDKGIDMPFYEHLNLSTLFRLQNRMRRKRFGMRKSMEMAGLDFDGTQHSGFDDAYNLARLTLTMFGD